MSNVVILFVILLVGRSILDTITIHKLTNKLMSRNYYDYALSDSVNKTMGQEGNKNILKEGLQMEEDLKEDLSPVNHFL